MSRDQGRSSWRVLGSFSNVFINKLIAHDRFQNYEHEQNFLRRLFIQISKHFWSNSQMPQLCTDLWQYSL